MTPPADLRVHVFIGVHARTCAFVAKSLCPTREQLLLWPEIEEGSPLPPSRIIDRVLRFITDHRRVTIATVHEIVPCMFSSMIRNKLIPATAVTFFGMVGDNMIQLEHGLDGDIILPHAAQEEWELDFHCRFGNPIAESPAYKAFCGKDDDGRG